MLTEAREALAEATASPLAPVLIRIVAGRGLGNACMAGDDPQAALAAFEEVVQLLPQVAPSALARADREYGLSRVVGLAADVAAAAAASQPERAVELLEQIRGILLGEAIDARSDLSELRRAAPELAAEFDNLRGEARLTAGVHPRVTQERLGHSTVGITLGTYSHVTAGMQADAAALVAGLMTTGVRRVRLPHQGRWRCASGRRRR